MSDDHSSQLEGVFNFPWGEFAGRLSVKQGDLARLTITTTTIIPATVNKRDERYLVHGVARNEKQLVTLYNCLSSGSFFNSFGLYQYSFVSNLVIFGAHELQLEELDFDNVTFGVSGLDLWLNKSVVEPRHDFQKKTTDLKIGPDISLRYKPISGITPRLRTYAVRSLGFEPGTQYIVTQKSDLSFEFAKKVQYNEIMTLCKRIENLFCLIFQDKCIVDETSYSKLRKIEKHEVPEVRVIHHVKTDYSFSKFNDRKVLIRFPDIESSFGDLLFKWFDLSEAIPYLDTFFVIYYSTKYIDSRALALINLVEAIHRFECGSEAVPIEEHREWVKKIVDQIDDEDDQERVHTILQDKNGYGLKAKLNYFREFVDGDILDGRSRDIAKFRARYSHGERLDSYSYDNLKKIHDLLQRMVNGYFRKAFLGQVEKSSPSENTLTS